MERDPGQGEQQTAATHVQQASSDDSRKVLDLSQDEPGMRRELPALLVALLGAAFFLAPTLRFGIGRDQAYFGYIGWSMLARKGPTCANAFVLDMPGAAFLHAVQIALLGRNVLSFRIFDVIYQMLTVALLFGFARMVFSRRASVFACWVYAYQYWSFGYWHTCQRDGFAQVWLLLMGWSLMKYLESDRGLRYLVAGGVSCACAAFLKGHFLLLPAIPAACVCWRAYRSRESISRAAMKLVLLGAIVLAPFCAYAAWHAVTGHWHEFSLSFLWGNLNYFVTRLPLFYAVESFRDGSRLWLVSAAVIGVALGVEKRLRQRARVALALFAFGAALPLLLRRYYLYHFTSLFCIASVFAGNAVDRLGRLCAEHARLPMMQSVLGKSGVFALLLLAPYFGAPSMYQDNFPTQVVSLLERGSLQRPYAPEVDPEYSLEALQAVSQYLKENVDGEETVVVFDLDPTIHFLSGLWPPHSMHMAALVLIVPSDHPWDAQRRILYDEFVGTMQDATPAFVVLPEDTLRWFSVEGADVIERLRDSPELAAAIEKNYRYETKIGHHRIYRRRTDSPE